ncbi:hypothetical protein, partial [Sideroxydans sp. CL21]
ARVAGVCACACVRFVGVFSRIGGVGRNNALLGIGWIRIESRWTEGL